MYYSVCPSFVKICQIAAKTYDIQLYAGTVKHSKDTRIAGWPGADFDGDSPPERWRSVPHLPQDAICTIATLMLNSASIPVLVRLTGRSA
jgi:hypothetical protein